MSEKILIIEDEADIRELLVTSLDFAGFETTGFETGEKIDEILDKETYDLILLDIMLPNKSGFEIAKSIRAKKNEIPIIFITAKDDNQSKVEGLAIGADDYITKPFSLEEVNARVRAVLRRVQKFGNIAIQNSKLNVLEIKGVKVLYASHSVFSDDKNIILGPTEFNLLKLLMQNANKVVSKEKILEEIWGQNWGVDTSIVETYISNIRKKLGKKSFITTKRSVGYVIFD